MLWVATVASAGMVFLTQIILARQLGPEAYGLFASSLAIVTMIAPLAGFGLSQYRLKAYGSEGWRAERWIRPSLRFSLITTVLAMVIVLVWAFLFTPDRSTRNTLIFLVPIIPALFAVDLVGSKLRLEERYASLSWWQILVAVTRFPLALALLVLPALGVKFVTIGYCVAALLVLGLAIPQLQKLVRGQIDLLGHGPREIERSGDPLASPSMLQLWAQAWPFGLAAILYPIFFQVSTVMLKYMQGDAAAGKYGLAMQVMMAVYLIPTTIYQKFLLSKLNRWASHDKQKFMAVYVRGAWYMPILGLAIALAIWACARTLVPIIFGQSYAQVSTILGILALCIPIRFLSTAVGSVLLTGGQMYFRVIAMGLAALVTIGLNLFFISRYDEVGAAFSTLGGELILLLLISIGARRTISADFSPLKRSGISGDSDS